MPSNLVLSPFCLGSLGISQFGKDGESAGQAWELLLRFRKVRDVFRLFSRVRDLKNGENGFARMEHYVIVEQSHWNRKTYMMAERTWVVRRIGVQRLEKADAVHAKHQ